MAWRRWYRVFGWATGLALATPADASLAQSKAPWTLDHFQHRGFTVNDGLPADGTTLIAQTAEGLIWLPVDDGLMTFDGANFRRFESLPGEHLAGADIYRIFAPSSGGLWVQYERGGFDLIRDGHVTHFAPTSDDVLIRMGELHQDRNGNALAVVGGSHFLRFDGHAWVSAALPDAPERVLAINTDHQFNVWILGAASGKVYRRREGQPTFEDMGVRVERGSRISVPNEHIVTVTSLSHQMYRFRVVGNNLVECGPPIPGVGAETLPDGHGGAWTATVTEGLRYFPSLESFCPAPPAVGDNVVFTGNKTTGATGDIALTALVDREGNIWSTSESGLDRYTRSAFSNVRFPRAVTMATIAPGADGSLWIGSEANDVFHYTGGSVASVGVASASLAMTSVPGREEVLAASPTGIWSLSPGMPRLVAPLPPNHATGYSNAVYRGADGTLWLAYGVGVFAWSKDTWERLPGVGRTRGIYGDGKGTEWFALSAPDSFAARTSTGLKVLTQADGVNVGVVKVVTVGQAGLWIAGERGVQWQKDGRFHALGFGRVEPPENVTGLLFDDDGDLWIHGSNGLYHVSAREVAQFTSSPSRPVTARVFDDGDGLPGPASQSHSLPSLVKGTDGRLWVQGGLAVSWLDPHDAGTRPEPSPPIILGMAVAGHPFDTSAAALTLPRDERSPVISYTAPATTNASRVRFQTRLTGFDDDWVDQAGRREVSYPHLAAGRYVFSVRASTDGVIWTKRPPQLVLSVQPFFYETWWFKACCVLLALLAVWMLAKWEAWRALRRYHAREKIRAEEREAVARDIHDTLLQSNVALILQLESISQTAPEGETRRRISALADSASEAVTEGREKVTALRERIAEGGSVDMRLKTLGGRLAQQSDARFRLSVVGEPRALRPVPADELYLLISEAVTNAFWHARATTVEVELNYGLRWLRVSVVDDGIGIAPSALRPEGRTGHWGISGMYERAGQLRARLAIGRRQPKGTDVRLDVPAKRIYVEQGAWRFMALG